MRPWVNKLGQKGQYFHKALIKDARGEKERDCDISRFQFLEC